MNKTSNYKFTILVPLFNEEDNIASLEKALGEYLPMAIVSSCVLFIDDGSKDSTLEKLKEICSRNSNFHYLSFESNRGLSAAIKAGFDYCCSPYVGYIDGDLQTNPQDFNLLLPHIEQFPLVMGIRAKRKDTWSKRMQSKIANSFRRAMTGDTAIDTGCPLKIFQTAYAKRIPMFKGMHRFFPALISLQDGGTYKQIAVRHYPRTAGVSKYSVWNRLLGPTRDCFAFRWMKKRAINYTVGESSL